MCLRIFLVDVTFSPDSFNRELPELYGKLWLYFADGGSLEELESLIDEYSRKVERRRCLASRLLDIVRSCPAQLGFACPEPPMRALSYGRRDERGKDLMCNYPGAVVDLTVDRSAGRRLLSSASTVVLVAGLAAAWGLL